MTAVAATAIIYILYATATPMAAAAQTVDAVVRPRVNPFVLSL